MKTCANDTCTRPVQGRGLCSTHYAHWHRSQKKYQINCIECGKTVMVARPGMTCCSRECRSKRGVRIKSERPATRPVATLNQCGWCNALHIKGGKYCADECRASMQVAQARAMRSPLRAAIEDGNHAEVIARVKDSCAVTEGGCWLWARSLSKDGYPILKVGKSQVLMHRAVLEAKCRAPLGSQAAHHMCADTRCVNPEHLQPVTQRENSAEMLARHSYLARIRDLERALAEVDPAHRLLRVVAVA